MRRLVERTVGNVADYGRALLLLQAVAIRVIAVGLAVDGSLFLGRFRETFSRVSQIRPRRLARIGSARFSTSRADHWPRTGDMHIGNRRPTFGIDKLEGQVQVVAYPFFANAEKAVEVSEDRDHDERRDYRDYFDRHPPTLVTVQPDGGDRGVVRLACDA